ncbi:glycosyl transferase family 1 [Candidatus Berkelbacteria bacterium CG10_big_fil_rev_8_21_14_0_10_43_13]|uniref:Glycosyl transferase family 1 n=1 Tax=Candidatus Berkelbacteria bacterium CG10_big_fil_rev_8_21_14_0_10_43_13 TaxID=1974514 RepID=A0A2H0W8J7_9BACT|nr:MAG: glycosyl transferase family 1 [Candidatus Berkelbacteria bacterium CG10_big_fil_rev_8_21_14_0_10_43_13]
MAFYKDKDRNRKKIILIASYRPRDCGIATFSEDLVNSLESLDDNIEVNIIAINEPARKKCRYSSQIKLEIEQENLQNYNRAVEYINSSDAMIVNIQHEYGLFGGKDGEFVVNLVKQVHKPVVVTLHTVLTKPSLQQKEILRTLAECCDAIVVMAEAAVAILAKNYNIPDDNIIMIPHGVPETDFENQISAKKQLRIERHTVLSTFGLIGPGKGLEYAIEALPKIKLSHPEVKYFILGRTHPNLISDGHDWYREKLLSKISDLNLDNDVCFVNRFLSIDEIISYLKATDICLTPYLNAQQITSGTLAYALSTGRVCISTPYVYAKELLKDGHGKIIPFRDSDAIAKSVLEYLNDSSKQVKTERSNYVYTRNMTWRNIAKSYSKLFNKVSLRRTKHEPK